MALTNLDFISWRDIEGGKGEWRYSYAAVPDGFDDWPAFIDAALAAAPYDTDARNKAWVYTELYTEAVTQDLEANPSLALGITEFRDGDLTVKLASSGSEYAPYLRKWSDSLTGRAYGSRLRTIGAHF